MKVHSLGSGKFRSWGSNQKQLVKSREFHQNVKSYWRLPYSKNIQKLDEGKVDSLPPSFHCIHMYTPGFRRHFPLNQLPLLGTNPPRFADDRFIGYTSGSFTLTELAEKRFTRFTSRHLLSPWWTNCSVATQYGMIYSTALIPPKPWIGTALPPGLDGLSWFIVHGIDLVQRIDIQLGKQSPWNLTPRWMVECFFWAQQFQWISPVIAYLWIPWVDIETDISAPISTGVNVKESCGTCSNEPCWAIYFTTEQWWDPVGFAVIFSMGNSSRSSVWWAMSSYLGWSVPRDEPPSMDLQLAMNVPTINRNKVSSW